MLTGDVDRETSYCSSGVGGDVMVMDVVIACGLVVVTVAVIRCADQRNSSDQAAALCQGDLQYQRLKLIQANLYK